MEKKSLEEEVAFLRGMVSTLTGAIAAQWYERPDREILTARMGKLAVWANYHLSGLETAPIEMRGVTRTVAILTNPKAFSGFEESLDGSLDQPT